MNTIITRGLGNRQRLLTRGFGGFFDGDGTRPQQFFTKVYDFGLRANLSRSNEFGFNVDSAVEMEGSYDLSARGSVARESSSDIQIRAKTDKRRLFDILDAI